MTPRLDGLNPIYGRSGLVRTAGLRTDIAQDVLDETEKVIGERAPTRLVRITRSITAAWLLACLATGGAAALGSTYAAWSDFVTIENNQAGADVWTIDVEIDVVNAINPDSGGLTQVKIFGSDSFDPATIDIGTVCFGSASIPAARSCDVVSVNNSGPGPLTIMVHFTTNQTGILAGDTTAVLTGKTFDGMNIFGIDDIMTVPGGAPAPAPTLRLAPAPAPSGGDTALIAPELDESSPLTPTPEPDVLPAPEPLPEPDPESTVDLVDSTPKTAAPPVVDAAPEPVDNTDTPPAPIELEPTGAPAEQPPAPVEPVPAEVEEPKVGEPKVVDSVEEPKPEPTTEGGETAPVVDETPTEAVTEPPILVPDLVDLSVRKATRTVLRTAGVPDEAFEPAIDAVETAAEAAALLTELCRDLLCGGVVFEERETDGAAPGTILEQSRAADAEWNADDTLTLVVAVAPPPPPPQTEPDPPSDGAGDSPPDEPLPSEDTVAKTADAETEAIATEPADSVTEEPADDATAADGGTP